MTTPEAAERYLNEYLSNCGTDPIVFNPHGRSEDQLPAIFGWVNGGSTNWYECCLIAEDGTPLGGHICSHPAYAPGDLGIVGGRMGRHETFRAHYPDGYRMVFVSYEDAGTHEGLVAAHQRAHEKQEAESTHV